MRRSPRDPNTTGSSAIVLSSQVLNTHATASKTPHDMHVSARSRGRSFPVMALLSFCFSSISCSPLFCRTIKLTCCYGAQRNSGQVKRLVRDYVLHLCAFSCCPKSAVLLIQPVPISSLLWSKAVTLYQGLFFSL
ncbi:hypothetical protein ES708_31112 [subsurface metagenome]